MLTFSFCCCSRAYCINRHLQSSPGFGSSSSLSRELCVHDVLHVSVVLRELLLRSCLVSRGLSFLLRCDQHVSLGHRASTTVGITISGVSRFVVRGLIVLARMAIDALVGAVSPVYRHVVVVGVPLPSVGCVHQSWVHGLVRKARPVRLSIVVSSMVHRLDWSVVASSSVSVINLACPLV